MLGAARATIRRTRYCLLATRASDGATSARVVQPHPPEGSELAVWLGTSPGTRKVRELRGDPHATLVYQDNRRSASVVLQGRVDVVEDLSLRRKYFMPSWIAFFPGGPDGDFVLLRFVPDRLEVIDFARHVTPEPFGQRALALERRDGAWVPTVTAS